MEPKTDIHKYYKPHSVTWWVGVIAFLFALLHGAVDVGLFDHPTFHKLRDLLDALSGDWTAKQYLMMSAGIIGLRGAMK